MKASAGRARAMKAAAARAALERDGLHVFERLFPLSLLKRIRADVLRRHDSGELYRRGLVRDIGGRRTSVLPLDKPYLDPRLYADPVLMRLLPSLLGPDFRLSSVEVVVALPGSTKQYQHIDGPIRFDRVSGGKRRPWKGNLSGLPPYALALATPLCDMTEKNGPTALWPGSHRVALDPRLPSEPAVKRRFPCVRMTGRFGFSYLYDYRTFHRGTPNLSREARPLLMLVFTRAWYRDPNLAEVDGGLAIAPRALARVPARFRELFALAPAARRKLWA